MIRTKEELKSYFETGDVPTEENFSDLIDTMCVIDGVSRSFVGVATPLTTPPSFENDVFYFALQSGVYNGFNNTTMKEGDIVIFINNDKVWESVPFFSHPLVQGNAENSIKMRGYDNEADGNGSMAIGDRNKAVGNDAFAGGNECEATGQSSFAFGSKTKSTGLGSHAEGLGSHAEGNYSHAEGNSSYAKGAVSHAEGERCASEGRASHVGGVDSVAKGANSFAHGEGLGTNIGSESAFGKFNKSTWSADEAVASLFSVGCGTSDIDRKNAIEVKKNGDVYIIGIGGFDGTNSDSALSLQEVIANLQ